MSARQKRERILRLLASAYASHRQWQQAREKALSQLQSMSNLAEQLVTLRRCTEAGRLGSVSGYPQLASLLEAKIITSFERSLSYLHKASETLADVCKQLRSQWKEAERLFSDIVALQGLEAVVTRTSQSFCLGDVVEWLKLLNAAHLYDLTEKQTVLRRVSCSPSSVEPVYHCWDKQLPTGLEGVLLDCIHYTVARIKNTGSI